MATEIIEIRNVLKKFPNAPRPALGPLSLTVKKGELIGVIGPSGSGKTTLLRLVAGFERPDSGSIALDGRVVADATHWVEPEARGVGMVFQDYALFPHLTAFENIAFGLNRRGRALRVHELLELVGLPDFAQRYPHELSGGEQQRVALARSLATNPKVLLLDEPFSNLDADLRPKMRAELKLILKRLNCTAIFVTHDQEEAFELADQVAVLNGGQLEQIDSPERLYREPATRFVAEFIGHADFLVGRIREDCIETAVGCFEKPSALPPNALVHVMIRPEEVELELVKDGQGIVVARRYRSGVQVIIVRLSSGEVVRSLQPVGAHFPLAARVRARAKTKTPVIFLAEAR